MTRREWDEMIAALRNPGATKTERAWNRALEAVTLVQSNAQYRLFRDWALSSQGLGRKSLPWEP